MPGRFTITKDDKIVSERFKAFVPKEFGIRYNVSPTQLIPVILDTDPSKIVMARWGWNPHFVNHLVINARSEGLDTNKLFGKGFRERRCLVIMDGYYEWEDAQTGKKPYRIILKDESLFTVAGVWIEETDTIRVATITTEPNELVGKIHERMPVIIPKEKEKTWLSHDTSQEELITLLKPYPAKDMTFYRVTTDMNSSKHDKKEYVEPYQEKETGEHQATLTSEEHKETQTKLTSAIKTKSKGET